MPHLLIEDGNGEPQEFELDGEPITIGRDAGHRVVLNHGSVSGRHAEITRHNGTLVLRDLGSSNGTKLNGQSIQEATLKDGDTISFGSLSAKFFIGIPSFDSEPQRQTTKPQSGHGAEHNDRVESKQQGGLDTDLGSAFGMEDGGDLGVSKAFGLFRSLDYGFLLPVRKILNLGLLRKRAVRWVLLFALTPIAIFLAAVNFDLDFKETVWLLEAYFCLFWALYFYTLMQPPAATWKRALGYALFTMIIGMPLDLVAQNLPVLRSLYESSQGDSWMGKVFGCVLGVGPLEEACKAMPLLIFGLRKGKIHGAQDGLFLGLISGLAFAVIEGVAYSFGASVAASQVDSNYAEAAFTVQVIQIIFRMMSSPVLHCAWSGIAGWFIGLAATRPKPRWPIVVVGIAFAGALHGLNDVFAGHLMHLVIAAISLMTLMAYLTHGTEPKASPVPQP